MRNVSPHGFPSNFLGVSYLYSYRECLSCLAAATESKPIAMDTNEAATAESPAGDSKPVELRASDSPVALVKTEALPAPEPEGGALSTALPAAGVAATGECSAPSDAAAAVASGEAKCAADACAPTTDAEDIRVYVSNIGQVCEQLLAAWSALREVFRIPRRQLAEQRKEAEKQLDDWTQAQRTLAMPVYTRMRIQL